MMLLGEYMRKRHPPPKDYAAPARKGVDIIKHIRIPVKHIEMARAFVMASICLAVILPGKWGILAGVVGNAYWLYKIR